MITAPSPAFIAARWHGGKQTPRAIVIHGTVSPCVDGGAKDVAKFFANHPQKTSAHYVVDPGTVVQCVGDHTVAYHCGHNTNTIGEELCDPQAGPGARWGDTNHKRMLARAVRLTAELCVVYDIEPMRPSIRALRAKGPHGIYGHDDSRLAFGFTTHVDPGPDFPWADFIHQVAREVAAIKGGRVPTKPNHVTRGRALIVQGLNELAHAKGRAVVKAQAAVIRAALAIMPKR